jgi:hypothetical protein
VAPSRQPSGPARSLLAIPPALAWTRMTDLPPDSAGDPATEDDLHVGGPPRSRLSATIQTAVDLTDALHQQTLIDAAVATVQAGRSSPTRAGATDLNGYPCRAPYPAQPGPTEVASVRTLTTSGCSGRAGIYGPVGIATPAAVHDGQTGHRAVASLNNYAPSSLD